MAKKDKLWIPRQTWNRKPFTQIIGSKKAYNRQKVIQEDRKEFAKEKVLPKKVKLWIDETKTPDTDNYRVISNMEELEHNVHMHRAGNLDIESITIGDRWIGIFNAEDVANKIVAMYGSGGPKGITCPTIILNCSFATDKIVKIIQQATSAKVRTHRVTGKLDD